MLRLVGGVIVGLVAWTVIVTLFNFGLRHGWPDYAAVEKAMAFTLPMMAARLSMSAISSLGSGYVAARIERGHRAPLITGICLLLMFVPVHYMLWDSFPVWYHLTFLVSLPLLGWAGGKLWSPGAMTAS